MTLNNDNLLIDVVEREDLSKVRELLDKGAEIEAKDKGGCTPLHLAALKGKIDTRYRRSIENDNSVIKNGQATSGASKPSSWMGSIVNWIKSSTESPALLTSEGHDSTTVTAVPEINTTVVNGALILGILAVNRLNETEYRQPIHENLLSPLEQSMKLNNIDGDRMKKDILQAAEKFGDPDTDMDEVEISGNKTGMWK